MQINKLFTSLKPARCNSGFRIFLKKDNLAKYNKILGNFLQGISVLFDFSLPGISRGFGWMVERFPFDQKISNISKRDQMVRKFPRKLLNFRKANHSTENSGKTKTERKFLVRNFRKFRYSLEGCPLDLFWKFRKLLFHSSLDTWQQ